MTGDATCPAPTLNSFKAVQDFLNEVITQNGTGISSAKHGAFWTNWTNMTKTTYTEFTTATSPMSARQCGS